MKKSDVNAEIYNSNMLHVLLNIPYLNKHVLFFTKCWILLLCIKIEAVYNENE